MSVRTSCPDGVKKEKANLPKGKEVSNDVAMAVNESLKIHAEFRDTIWTTKKINWTPTRKILCGDDQVQI